MSATARDQRRAVLARRYQRDPSVTNKHALIADLMPLARALARAYYRGHEPLEDLEQVAVVGLLLAVERFDPDRGMPIAPYATIVVRGELRRHYRDRGWFLHVPRRLKEDALRVAAADADASRSGSELSDPALAAQLKMSCDDVREARNAWRSMRPPSVDALEGPDTASLAHHDAGFDRADARMDLGLLARRIPHRQREVVLLRYGADLTQSEIGARIGVSQMQVSRLLKRAMTTLGSLEDHHG